MLQLPPIIYNSIPMLVLCKHEAAGEGVGVRGAAFRAAGRGGAAAVAWLAVLKLCIQVGRDGGLGGMLGVG